MVLRRHISDITQCPICLDVLDTSTSLPCLHTFCLCCLQRIFTVDYPGDVATCPVCRQDFQLPEGGLAALPRNFTLDGLVELCSTTRPTSAPPSLDVMPTVEPALNDKSREICTHDETRNDEMLKTREKDIPAAEANSGNTKGNDGSIKCSLPQMPHEHDPRPSAVSTEDVAMSTTTCDKHTGTVDAEFCFDCRVDVCEACCGDVHRRHRRRPVSEVSAECRRRIAGEMSRVTDALNATYVALLDVDQRRADILEKLRQKEDLVRKECKEAEKDEIEKRLRALSAQKDNDLRQLAGPKEQLDFDQASLETFLKNGARKLTTVTTTAGLLHLVKDLKIEANSVLSVHQTRLDKSKVDGKQRSVLTGIDLH